MNGKTHHTMKKILRYYIVGIIALLFFSCSDDKLDEIGKNPNNSINVPSKLLISQTTLTTAFEIAGTDLAWYTSIFSEQTAGVHGQIGDADKRKGINSTIGNNSWNAIYAGTLKDLYLIIEKCSEGGSEAGNNATKGIAEILSAYAFSVLTDLWGEVPFSQALNTNYSAPEFDTQEQVYAGMFGLLNAGIADLGLESVGNPGEFDFFYGGDADSWIKAAYSLKVRLFNHLSNVVPAYTDSIIDNVDKTFSDATESMIFSSFGTGASEQSPWFQEEADRGHHAVSKTLDDILVSLNDPRRTIWFATMPGDIIVPAPPGNAISDQGHEIYSRIIVHEADPMPIITYDEVKFIEAEAYLRNTDPVNAYAAYLAGVEEAMLRAGIDQTDVDAYMLQASVSMGSSNLTLQDIIIQKYISLYLFQPIEAYNDIRRTGYPVLHNAVGPPPNRFPYPNDEVATNPNVPDKTSVDKVWWAL
jgi:hypothetical protein